MNKVSRLFFQSVMNYINMSLFVIIAIAMLSIFFSFWVSEKADNDAKAINLSGTMRMQVYHIGMSLFWTPKETTTMIDALDETWNDPLFTYLQAEMESDLLNEKFLIAHSSWKDVVKPAILSAIKSHEQDKSLLTLIDRQVELTDTLVDEFQSLAEAKIRQLRTIQFIALIITTLIGSIIFYLLRNRIELPLRNLTLAARKISRGEFDENIPEHGHDELTDLAKAFNQMRASIQKTWSELEDLVTARTQELQRNNTIVTFLYNTAQTTINSDDHSLDHSELVDQLSQILENCSVELCFFTAQGHTPYLRSHSGNCKTDCHEGDCITCLSSNQENTQSIALAHHYSIEYQEKQYGVLTVHSDNQSTIEPWQDTLLKSCTDQIAIALSLQDNMNQEYRLAMLRERTVIARELHDSLAQSLSYLQIQVTRLQKARDKGRDDIQGTVITELKEGLSSAYRHLRELLTTFRLKLDDEGLEGALKQTTNQLAAQTEMEVDLDYGLNDLPLSPNEEIHLMQIVREATQNAVNHSKGTHLWITLEQSNDQKIKLSVEDNGTGLPKNPEKLNHYGLAIMQERSKHLGGEITITNSDKQGVKISVIFTPTYLQAAT